jgi:probable HAF family extracellular repeat protein
MNSAKGLRSLRMILGALLCATAAQAAHAAITVLESHLTLLNVVDASGNELVETRAGAAALGPGLIVGVYPNTSGAARGFTVTNPVGPPVPLKVPARMIPVGSLTWVEPYDVNSSGVYVGQARGNGPLYAARSTGALPGLDNASLWSASAATSINNNGVIVGWKQPIIPPGQPNAGQPGAEQAFYYTGSGAVQSINIPGAASSRALSVNTPSKTTDSTLVTGFFRPATGNGAPHGFVVELKPGPVPGTFIQGTPRDIGRVVIPTIDPFDQAHYVSINAGGVVAATRPVVSGSETFYQAFILDGQGHSTAIPPIGAYEDTFATGISDTGWVVGVLRDRQGPDSGFLWVNGKLIDLSLYAHADGWTGITWALDVYSNGMDSTGKETGTIVGVGTYLENGVTKQRAFAMQMTMQVPEPQTYVMLGLGLLAIGALRMRRLGRP